MIYLTPERKLGRVIIAIWTGPIMPWLTVMSVQVLKTVSVTSVIVRRDSGSQL